MFFSKKEKIQCSYTTGIATTKNGCYNKFRSYKQVVDAISSRMSNNADFGCRLTRVVVNYRSAWILSDAFTVTGGDSEQGFIDSLIESTDLRSIARDIATLSEQQGHVITAIKLKDGVFQLKNLGVVSDKYKVSHHNNKITAVEVLVSDKYIQVENFAAVVTAHVSQKSNSIFADSTEFCTVPVVGILLNNIDNTDRAAADLRQINSLFASPTPIFSFETDQKSSEFGDWLKSKKWKIGQFLSIPERGTATMLQATTDGAEMLLKEMTSNAQAINSLSGIAVYLLGYPELIGGGRATAQESVESINVLTSIPRAEITNVIKNIVKKCMLLWNEQNGTTYNPLTVNVVNPPVALSQIMHEFSVIDKMRERGDIDRKTYLESSSIIADPDQVIDRINEDQSLAVDKVLSNIKSQADL